MKNLRIQGCFDLIYALDIGTRTVIGVLAEKYESSITIYDTLIMEHEERAMLDGAIHDVNKVTKIVQHINFRSALAANERSFHLFIIDFGLRS